MTTKQKTSVTKKVTAYAHRAEYLELKSTLSKAEMSFSEWLREQIRKYNKEVRRQKDVD